MFIVYDGPSRFTGKPIIAIITFRTKNQKIGNMSQLWILDKNTIPYRAIQTGADDSVCGDCALRGEALGTVNKGRRCYVNTSHAPRGIWEAYHAGSYRTPKPMELRTWLRMFPLRLGAYGEPAALPTGLVRKMAIASKGWTGYTHAWKRRSSLRNLCMASVESIEEAQKAWSKGWRTFRIRQPGEPRMKNEVVCPASEEAGHITTCADCRLCEGLNSSSYKSVVIFDHGPQKKRS